MLPELLALELSLPIQVRESADGRLLAGDESERCLYEQRRRLQLPPPSPPPPPGAARLPRLWCLLSGETLW
jgi:hypothetical protein